MIDDADIVLAGHLADAAGAAIRPYWRCATGLETKDDASPVTLADRAAEAAIRAILEQERPEDGIVGEEYGTVRGGADRLWILDPIDGTRSFIAGRPIFGTLIALAIEGAPSLGVIDQPILHERWVGVIGIGTTLNGAPVRTRGCATIGEAHVATTGPNYLSVDERALFEPIGASAAHLSWGGDCYNYALVASGLIDLVIEAGLKLHDYAALAPVVEGAGGRMVDWSGVPLGIGSDGRVVAVGDARLLEAVLEALGV